jgi:hypothetical protein
MAATKTAVLAGYVASNALQNALQHAAAGPRTASHEKIDPSKSRKTCDEVRNNATQCEGTGSQIVGQRGREQGGKSSRKSAKSEMCAAHGEAEAAGDENRAVWRDEFQGVATTPVNVS